MTSIMDQLDPKCKKKILCYNFLIKATEFKIEKITYLTNRSAGPV